MTVWYPSTNSSLQISIFQIHQIFNISYFPQFNLSRPLRKNISFPKCPKITQKFTQNRQTVVMVISIETYPCLKRDLGRVKRRQNRLRVCPRLNLKTKSLGRLLFRPKMITYTLTAIKSCSADQQLMLSNGDQKPEK